MSPETWTLRMMNRRLVLWKTLEEPKRKGYGQEGTRLKEPLDSVERVRKRNTLTDETFNGGVSPIPKR